MPPTCSVCSHEKRKEINRALIMGKSARVIARQVQGLAHDAINRHRECIAESLERTKDSDSVTARGVLLEVLADMKAMLDDVRSDEDQVTPNAKRRMLLEVTDRLTRAADSFAKVNREVVTSTFHLFAQLGVRDEGEIRSALELARGAQNLTLDDCELDGVELLRMVVAQRPERRVAILAALGREPSKAEVVEANGHTNGGRDE